MTNFTDFKKEFSSYTESFGQATDVLNEPDIFKNINTLYGVPMCVLDLVKGALISILPTSFLKNVSNKFKEGYLNASRSMNAKVQNSFLQNGLFKYNPETGRFEWNQDDSLLEDDDLGFLGDMSLALAEIQGNIAFYANSINGTLNQIEDLLNCVGKFLAWEASKSEYNVVNDIFGPVLFLEDEIKKDTDFLALLAEGQEAVTKELIAREQNPFLEPLVADTPELDASPFRLVYGPPKSTNGQFLLSVDGIYYDSQSGGIPFLDGSGFLPASAIPTEGLEWLLSHEPNLGGKGEEISFKTIEEYRDTIFSLDVIDNSKSLKEVYDIDPLLNKLEGQRNLELSKINDDITTLLGTYAEDSALVVNARQSLQSTSSKYTEKISKRKKQIELYVKFSPEYKEGDKLPVNDFSFITNSLLVPEIEKQKKLVFKQGELDGVVLPVEPKFVKAADASKVSSFTHLQVGNIGEGEISFVTDYTSSGFNVTNLNDSIITDELIAVYNFLNSTVSLNASTYDYSSYKLTNYGGTGNFGKLVGEASSVYTSGLTIPKIDGLVNDSFIVLPDTDDFRDLTYKKDGFSISFWVHVPDLNINNSWEDDSYRRVIMSADNVGGTQLDYALSTLVPIGGSDTVKGLQIGFATHKQLAASAEYTTTDSENEPGDQLVFYMAPTQSYGPSSIGFINKVDDNHCVVSSNTVYGLMIDTSTTTSSVNIDNTLSTFVDITITVSPNTNEVKLYVDSVLMKEITMEDAFGVNPYGTANLPTQVLTNSFEPSSGPPTNPSLFTPWVMGSSYVDELLGFDSGLKAFIGSVKFYSKALDNNEVLTNYNAQQAYFKGIEV